MTIAIASAKELARALEKAQGGETFVLAPGNYGHLRIDDLEFDRAVTIRSADPMNLAKFSGLEIRDSENISFVGLELGRAMTKKEVGRGKIVSVFDSESIAFDGLSIHGNGDGDPRNDGYGFYAIDSESVSLRNSNFTDLARGAVFDSTSNVVVEGNSFRTLRTDGLNFTSVDDVLIKNNQFRDFHIKAGDHADAIQFWTTGQTRGSSNIVITGNQMFEGNGFGPQGIFLRDETGRNPYKNVLIHNNLMYGSDSHHGIAVLGGQGVTITNNTAVSPDNDSKNFWIKVEAVAGATIENNVTDFVVIGKGVSGVNQSNNLVLYENNDPREALLNLNKGAQTTIADLILSGIGYAPNGAVPAPSPSPSPSPPPNPGPAAATALYGTTGHDHVRGTNADERLFGIAKSDTKLGVGSRDTLLGSGGRDVFVLGDQRGVFYHDRKNDAGRKDYASIRDFEAGDRIQLAGQASDYVLRSEKFGRAGVGIYLDTNDNNRWDKSDELIAHVSGDLLPKSLDADYFSFG